MKHQGACKCGAVKVGILTEPFMKYNCHCSHCRSFASKYEKEVKAYHPAMIVWRWSVKVEGDIDYEQSVALGGLFALKRGRCANCKQPVWEKGERLAAPYAMVMAPALDMTPDTNIYYDSGYKKGPNDMKVTIYSDFGSLMYEMWILVTVALPLFPASILALLKKNEFKKE
mmetsp:Transcript_14314/g.23670  ORF Transcript_14314/g.23670 Transcript_14314/m.23670 type:complete len:171 (-) Transcript_14314:151-663(-)